MECPQLYYDVRVRVTVCGSARFCIALWMLTLIPGCSSSDATSHAPQQTALQPGDERIDPREPIPERFRPVDQSGLPVPFAEGEYADGTPMHYADGSPTLLGDGAPIDYRPRNIMRQLQGSAVAYLREPSGELVLLRNAKTSPMLDPDTGATCWLAYECTNPTCPGPTSGGVPNLYAVMPPGVNLSADGTLQHDPRLSEIDPSRRPTGRADEFRSAQCPKCGQATGQPYVPADIARRRTQLLQELDRVQSNYVKHADSSDDE